MKVAKESGGRSPVRKRIAVVAMMVLGVIQVGCQKARPNDAPEQPELASSAAAPLEATSLLGEPLLRNPPAESIREEFERNLSTAGSEWEANPDSAEALIWLGRRTAYLGRYQEAIDIFGLGLQQFPQDPRFLRHRGHRLLSTRQLDRAVEDFSAAYAMVQGTQDQVEPDGMPNAQGVPTSTLHSNIRYHLGLAHYLKGDFDAALQYYQEDVEKAGNPDMRVASSYWLYLTLRRLGRDQEAATLLASIDAELKLIENFEYHRLLLFFAGALERAELVGSNDGVAGSAEETLPGLKSATVSYGVATFDLVEGRADQAGMLYRQIVAGPQWSAFGYLAAEAELAHWGNS